MSDSMFVHNLLAGDYISIMAATAIVSNSISQFIGVSASRIVDMSFSAYVAPAPISLLRLTDRKRHNQQLQSLHDINLMSNSGSPIAVSFTLLPSSNTSSPNPSQAILDLTIQLANPNSAISTSLAASNFVVDNTIPVHIINQVISTVGTTDPPPPPPSSSNTMSLGTILAIVIPVVVVLIIVIVVLCLLNKRSSSKLKKSPTMSARKIIKDNTTVYAPVLKYSNKL